MRRVGEDEVARILSVVAAPPNRRARPLPHDLQGDYTYWFDGGAVRQDTGSESWFFADGATAWRAWPAPQALSMSVRLPDGRTFTVQQGADRP